MATEIERKFLVNVELLQKEIPELDPDCRAEIKQGYLAIRPGFSIRVRRTTTNSGKIYSEVQIKTGTGVSHKEYGAELYSDSEIEELFLQCIFSPIEKTRWEIKYYVGYDDSNDITYEVDFFHGKNEGLVLAEIELYREDQEFYKPPWILDEVTDDHRYYNVNLAINPMGK